MSILKKYEDQGSILSNPKPTQYNELGVINPKSLVGSNLDLAATPESYSALQAKTSKQWLDGSTLDLPAIPTKYSSSQLG